MEFFFFEEDSSGVIAFVVENGGWRFCFQLWRENILLHIIFYVIFIFRVFNYFKIGYLMDIIEHFS